MKKVYILTETIGEQVCILADGFKTKQTAIKKKKEYEQEEGNISTFNVHEVEVQ